ncbi:MAG: response regulator [Bacteroidetes bacterium]|nr:response regulator [Bacteroidota bacterium]
MKRILIVENDLLLAMINKRFCQLLGHEVVHSARNAEEAIAAVKKHSPDIILMDIKIDGHLDGIEAMHEIRKFSEAKVVYFTGNSEPSVITRAEQTNMLAFCVKPISLEYLKDILS